MTTHVGNYRHGFSRTLRHRGPLPSLRALRAAIRESRPADCRSVTEVVREDGHILGIREDGKRSEVYVVA